ncbi:MAG: hypothetical protein JF886_04770 [Candidatus Dormibacteraeota bacterium]|uniref:Uncharacterized protein n=1 Tax=Candidatus Aeolococcus gillhamiae TaxID=3127015 RepID=A0A934N4S5_9BACT|nr:hypothetical protein [Candidatus Dormibacteraeota bacterium]
MDTVYRGWNWSAQRLAALLVGLMAVVLLAASGGYLIRGATTLVVTHTITKTVAIPATHSFSGARTSGGFIPGV